MPECRICVHNSGFAKILWIERPGRQEEHPAGSVLQEQSDDDTDTHETEEDHGLHELELIDQQVDFHLAAVKDEENDQERNENQGND